ncbi:MAG: hypothetical protein R3A79_24475 [Nannocystaceae bacterium]
MSRRPLAPRPALALPLVAAAALACGKPASPAGGDDDFAQAGVQGSGQPLVTGKSLELVSWLVQFNRLNSPEKLEAMLNKTPGKFVPVDADNDGTNDYIAVSEDPEPARDKHALVLHARPSADDDGDGVLVATLFFTEDWALTGYSRSVSAAPVPSPTRKAVAAASAAAYSASEQSAPTPEPAVAAAPAGDDDDADDPALAAGSPKVPGVVAVPTGSDEAAGLHPVD